MDGNFYNYNAYIRNLLTYDVGYKSSVLSGQGYTVTESDYFNEKSEANEGW